MSQVIQLPVANDEKLRLKHAYSCDAGVSQNQFWYGKLGTAKQMRGSLEDETRSSSTPEEQMI